MNEFIDKLIEYGLGKNETRLLWLVIRRTWGMKSQAWSIIKWDYMLEKTKLPSSSLSHARSKLIARNILHTKPGRKKKSLFYKINSKVSTWIPGDKLNPIWESQLVQPIELKKKDKLVQPIELSSFNPLNQLVQPIEPVPIKRKIIKTSSLKTNTGTFVCDDQNIEILTPQEQLHEDAKLVLDCLNELSGKEFTYDDNNLEPIIERLDNGASLNQCCQVCFNKWEDHTFQNQFFRPSTLFKKNLFEGYLNSKGNKFKPATKQDETRYYNAKVLYEREMERRQNEKEARRDCEDR